MSNPIVDPLVEIVDTSSTTELVRIEATIEGAVTIVLNRPERRNAFNADLISALEEALRTVAVAEGVRAVFLRGSAGTFSAGGDIDEMRRAADRTEGENREDALALAQMMKQLWDMPQMTIALIEGPAIGAGAGIAAACDVAVATADARFGFSEVKLGLFPSILAPYAVNAIGPRHARTLFVTGRLFDAAFAERIGLISEVVPDAAALQAAHDRIAGEVLACAPGAVAEAKRMVADVFARPIDHGLVEMTAHRIAAARVSEEGQEGVRAFLERRRPRWAAGDGAPG
jgi:methylglutaconyl-CoA hydratase